ncbi:hypothetical protein MPER_12625 [Moniliophthora perniciosa FA553]|nr:hypothetical protein MPER_12625 [Moniliophthora perniciosa FA553]
MPQDRLAAARAQRQHGESEHEMSTVRGGVQLEASTTQQFLTEIETLGNNTRDLGIKGKLTQQEGEMRMNRLAHVRTKFVEALQEYQRVEQDHRTKVRERAERQFRIVQPDATPEQARQAVESDSGSQIFMQALVNVDSSRYAESRDAYSEVQSRHEEIKKLESTRLSVPVIKTGNEVELIQKVSALIGGDYWKFEMFGPV